MKVIIYCRVSSDEQREGTSLDVQEERLRRHCEAQGYEIINLPCREDESAKTFTKRPIIQDIFKYITHHQGEVDKLLFIRWDRFSRNITEATSKVQWLRDLGVEPNAIEAELDFNSDIWPIMLGVQFGLAQADNIKRSNATKDGIHGTLKAGRCANRAPRGYKNVRVSKHETHVEIDSKWANTIRKAFKEVAKGVETPCSIQRRLCPSIPQSSFLDMLRNKFYIGKIHVPAYKGEDAEDRDGLHEPLIDETTFYKVQDILDGKRKQVPKMSKKINPDLYLRKYLICPICGHALTGATSRGNGGQYTYYNCCHDAKHIRVRAEDANEGFARYVGSLKPNEVVLNLYNEILNDLQNERNSESKKQIDKMKLSITELEQRMEKVENKFIDDEITKEDYDRLSKRIKGQISEIKENVDILSATDKGVKKKIDYSVSLINNLDKYMRYARVEVKCKLIGSMFPNKIQYDGKKYRTDSYNKVLELIFQETKQLRGYTETEKEESYDSSNSVPRPGLEPGWVAPLVFETSASTYSAIWAWLVG